jgi:hypothetical protein
MSVGSRIRVEGEFEGFGYATDSLMFTLSTEDLCNEDGAGLVFVELADASEKEKLLDVHPGASITIEGTIAKIEEARFIHIDDAVVP